MTVRVLKNESSNYVKPHILFEAPQDQFSTTNFSEKPTSHISSLRAAAGWASSCCHADTRHRSSNAFITRAVVAHELPHGTKFGAAGTTIVAANSDEGDPTCDLHTKLEGHIPHPSPATGHEIDTYAVHECPK